MTMTSLYLNESGSSDPTEPNNLLIDEDKHDQGQSVMIDGAELF